MRSALWSTSTASKPKSNTPSNTAFTTLLVVRVVKAVLLGVFDFGFDAVLVLHSALLMHVAGIR